MVAISNRLEKRQLQLLDERIRGIFKTQMEARHAPNGTVLIEK